MSIHRCNTQIHLIASHTQSLWGDIFYSHVIKSWIVCNVINNINVLWMLADGLTLPIVCAPQTVTCTVGSGEVPTSLSSLLPAVEAMKASVDSTMAPEDMSTAQNSEVTKGKKKERSVVLAGLHACGDLSATMLRYAAFHLFCCCSVVAAHSK